MTWASNFGAIRHSIGSLETKRAKKVQKLCIDCGAGIAMGRKVRCSPCYSVILEIRNRATSKRYYEAKKAKNGGAA